MVKDCIVTLGGLGWGLFGGLSQGSDQADSKDGEKEAGKGDDEPTPWVRVLTVYNIAEAQIAAARLRDESIPVRMSQEAASSAIPVSVGILGQIHLYVPEPYADRAAQILDDTMNVGEETDESDEPDAP